MKKIERYSQLDNGKFEILVKQDHPFIISNGSFGECLQKWNLDYLSKKLEHNQVIVHASQNSNLNFIEKNFRYIEMNFAEFLRMCSTEHDHYYYLRSVGNDKRCKEVANIKSQFPSVAQDVELPMFMDFCQQNNCISNDCSSKKHIFSSVFRISSKNLVLWTHYDVMDNILLQINGKKKIILFPPKDVPYLYMNGDKSEINDLEIENNQKYPEFKNATKYECILEKGDALFIPSFWFHQTKALDFSIGVNFFWKNLDLLEFYNKSDIYGNKDFIPARDANANIENALKHLSKLPEKYKNFYINMMISKMKKKLN